VDKAGSIGIILAGDSCEESLTEGRLGSNFPLANGLLASRVGLRSALDALPARLE